MAVGDLTVSVVGTYNTLALAVAAMDAGNDATVDDRHYLYIEPGVGANRYIVVKYARSTV